MQHSLFLQELHFYVHIWVGHNMSYLMSFHEFAIFLLWTEFAMLPTCIFLKLSGMPLLY